MRFSVWWGESLLGEMCVIVLIIGFGLLGKCIFVCLGVVEVVGMFVGGGLFNMWVDLSIVSFCCVDLMIVLGILVNCVIWRLKFLFVVFLDMVCIKCIVFLNLIVLRCIFIMFFWLFGSFVNLK